MGVAHGDGADRQGLAVDLKWVGRRFRIRQKRDALWRQHRGTHVHPHLAVGLHVQSDGSGGGAYRDLGLVGEPLIAHEAGEAAGAVPALLHLGSVGVEDAVVEVGAWQARRLYQKDLVAADSEAPVRQAADARGVQMHGLAHPVKDHEIVA